MLRLYSATFDSRKGIVHLELVPNESTSMEFCPSLKMNNKIGGQFIYLFYFKTMNKVRICACAKELIGELKIIKKKDYLKIIDVPFSEIYTEETWLNKIHQCLEARKSNLCNFVDIKKGYIIDFEQKRKVLIDSRKVGVHGDKRSGLRYNLCLIHERVERLAVDLNKLLIVKNILTIFINTLKNEG